MRISDWSSDVCSSDLERAPVIAAALDRHERARPRLPHRRHVLVVLPGAELGVGDTPPPGRRAEQLGQTPVVVRARDEIHPRSEQRRLRKELASTCSFRWTLYHSKKTKTTNTNR